MSELSSLIARRYGDVARAYKKYWAPQLLAFAQPLLGALPLRPGAQVLDLGGGTGTLAARIARRTGEGSVVIADLSPGMMAQAKEGAPLRVAADVTRLPIADDVLDVVISTFALQHVRTPGRVIAEAARTLRRGGVVGTVTWGTDHGESGGAYKVIESVYERRRVPPDELATMKTWHAQVETPAQMRRYARPAGLEVVRAWTAQVVYEWKPANMLAWCSSMGPYGRRLAALDPQRREHVIAEIENRFKKLTPGAFVWAPEVVFLLATKR